MQYEYVECLSHLPRNFQMTYDILPALGIEEKLCRFDCVDGIRITARRPMMYHQSTIKSGRRPQDSR